MGLAPFGALTVLRRDNQPRLLSYSFSMCPSSHALRSSPKRLRLDSSAGYSGVPYTGRITEQGGASVLKQIDGPEVQRLWYLSELGISTWYPRRQLPGARETELINWQEPALPATAGPEQPVMQSRSKYNERPAVQASESSDSKREAPTIARKLRSREPEAQIKSPTSPPPSPQTIVQDGSASSADTVLSFQWLFFHVDERLALLCHQPVSTAAELKRQQKMLLRNILYWLGQAEFITEDSRYFRWPLPGVVQNDAEAAGSSLLAFLQQTAIEKPFANLVVMGETLLDTLQLDLSAQDAGWQTFVTASLPEMLSLPELKREAWQRLLPLHSILTRNPS